MAIVDALKNDNNKSVATKNYVNTSGQSSYVPSYQDSNYLNNSINIAEILSQQQELYNASSKSQMQYNSTEAQKNRDWQEYMSNTSYQRMVKDLQAAGLNPYLAYYNGGSSTPSGSSASSSLSNNPDLLNAMTSLAISNNNNKNALDIAKLNKEKEIEVQKMKDKLSLEELKLSQKKLDVDTENTEKSRNLNTMVAISSFVTALAEMGISLYKTHKISNSSTKTNNLLNEIANLISRK